MQAQLTWDHTVVLFPAHGNQTDMRRQAAEGVITGALHFLMEANVFPLQLSKRKERNKELPPTQQHTNAREMHFFVRKYCPHYLPCTARQTFAVA